MLSWKCWYHDCVSLRQLWDGFLCKRSCFMYQSNGVLDYHGGLTTCCYCLWQIFLFRTSCCLTYRLRNTQICFSNNKEHSVVMRNDNRKIFICKHNALRKTIWFRNTHRDLLARKIIRQNVGLATLKWEVNMCIFKSVLFSSYELKF